MNIFVAITCADGRLHFATSNSLIAEQEYACNHGHRLVVMGVCGIPYIDRARNSAVDYFLKSDCDRMVFIDYDVSWAPGELCRLAQHREPLVAGLYPFKTMDGKPDYPVEPMVKGYWECDERGLIKLRHVPTGFLAISREVFARFREKYPQRTFMHKKREHHLYFWCPYGMTDHGFPDLYGEDVAFCLEWVTMGGEVWADPSFKINHHEGRLTYEGRFAEWLQEQRKECERDRSIGVNHAAIARRGEPATEEAISAG